MIALVGRPTIQRWASALGAGLTQGLCGPALQWAIQAQLPALVPAMVPDGRAEGIAGASRVLSLKGVQA